MRRRIVRLAVVAAVLAIGLFGLPLAGMIATYLLDDERSELGRAAEIGALRLSAEVARGEVFTAVPDLEPDMTATLYDAAGARVSGPGPSRADEPTQLALTGRIVTGDAEGDLVEAVPVADDGQVVGALRVSTPRSVIYPRVAAVWLMMLALGVAAAGAVWLVARQQAARLASPLEQLARSAHRMGEGDFGVRTRASDIAEIDAVGSTLNRTTERIGDTIARERAFAADASHQLRTPLAGLRLGLETALDPPGQDLEAAIREAIGSTDRLERTVVELLALSREATPSAGPLDLDELLTELREDWHGVFAAEGRPLRIQVAGGLPVAAASLAAVRQITTVLLDNARRHGRGTVTVTVRDAAEAVAIDVADEGTGVADVESLFVRRSENANGHGIGLALARSLTEAEAGRLLLTSTSPVTFTLFLPLLPALSGREPAVDTAREGRDGRGENGLDDPPEQRFVGARDLAVWPSAIGGFAVRVALRLRESLGPYLTLAVTLVVGLVVVGLLTAGAGAVYDAVSESDGIAVLDQPVLHAAIALRTPAADAVIGAYTQLGGAVLMPLLAGAVAIGLALWWRRWTPIVLVAATAAGSLTLTIVGKAVVGRTRPPFTDAVPPYELSASFPSGHSLNTMALVAIVCYLLIRGERTGWARALTIGLGALFAITIGLTRVYLGHHWLTDVVVAWALGLAWAATVVVAHRLFLTMRAVPRGPDAGDSPADRQDDGLAG